MRILKNHNWLVRFQTLCGIAFIRCLTLKFINNRILNQAWTKLLNVKYGNYFFQNHCIERIWVEINGRVNFPIKTALIQLEENRDLDMQACEILCLLVHYQSCTCWYYSCYKCMEWTFYSRYFIYIPQLPWLFAMLIIFIG